MEHTEETTWAGPADYGFTTNCTPPAIDDFPKDLFTEKQRQDGAVVLHVIASLYLFVALAVVCDKYFVPAVERICQALNMSNDVAGATFMAAATSAPELFVNVIGTFITEGDIGVGTIVGSAVFNILAVAACCGIGAGIVVPLDWWPLTRDCLAYGVTVSIMICIIHDERVEWYEALTLVLLYIVYTAVMYWDKAIQQCARGQIPEEEDDKKQPNDPNNVGILSTTRMFHWPRGQEWWRQMAWLLVWPIHLVFLVTIPDCEKPRFKRWFPLTFLMCIVWIGSLSYVVAWMITIIGDTLKIPDSVMGITFLAAGTSVPEAVSSVIVAKQGQHFVGINSRGLEYSAISLLSTLMLLYATFSCNKFQLDRKVGQACLLMYGMFLVLASLIELNVFFMVNLPTCGR
ncbi:Sodium/potassium/calcium exchanger 5 [Blattella germanica]|nr:Sodium/potassium/calcium exchanger 5 [Blattella germanica]